MMRFAACSTPEDTEYLLYRVRLMDQTASGNLTYEEFAQTHALLVNLLKQFQGADTCASLPLLIQPQSNL